MHRKIAVLVIFCALAVLMACGGPPVQPLAFRRAPWQPGEVSQYDLASLVMRSITQQRPRYLVAALALHAALGFWAVIAAAQYGIAVTEVGVFFMALFALWIIWRLREQPTATPLVVQDGVSSPALAAANLQARPLSPEELARRANQSKYE